MKKNIFIFTAIIISFLQSTAQTLEGQLKQHAGQTITLTGFDYYESFELAKTTVDSLGNFSLNYSKTYNGMGILQTQDNTSLVVVLTEPTIKIQGTTLRDLDSLKFENSIENQNLKEIASTYNSTNQAYSAWRFLQPKYQKEKALREQKKVMSIINKELFRLEQANQNKLNSIDKNLYVYWFAPLRKLINDMPKSAKNYTERIAQNIQAFRNIDLNNKHFKTSGLFKDLLEGHYMLLENMGQPLDSVYKQMNISTKYIIDHLKYNETLLNKVSEALFNYFEKRSLFEVSEFLSVALLNDNQCTLEENLIQKLERYRKLKVGVTAPDIQLSNNQKLSDIKTSKLLVFGASWCPTCKDDALTLLGYYDAWKTQKNIAVIYISLDTDKATFEEAYKHAPWQMYCDFKGWDSQAAKDYFVDGTPTYFLLDANNTILVRPNSLMHADVWIKHKL